ncbi:MAG: hypothetical protein FJX77_08115 [Armatimonadetes bacterium]|nr:hypothetical protein [Armatimonadota bacterium]
MPKYRPSSRKPTGQKRRALLPPLADWSIEFAPVPHQHTRMLPAGTENPLVTVGNPFLLVADNIERPRKSGELNSRFVEMLHRTIPEALDSVQYAAQVTFQERTPIRRVNLVAEVLTTWGRVHEDRCVSGQVQYYAGLALYRRKEVFALTSAIEQFVGAREDLPADHRLAALSQLREGIARLALVDLDLEAEEHLEVAIELLEAAHATIPRESAEFGDCLMELSGAHLVAMRLGLDVNRHRELARPLLEELFRRVLADSPDSGAEAAGGPEEPAPASEASAPGRGESTDETA